MWHVKVKDIFLWACQRFQKIYKVFTQKEF